MLSMFVTLATYIPGLDSFIHLRLAHPTASGYTDRTSHLVQLKAKQANTMNGGSQELAMAAKALTTYLLAYRHEDTKKKKK